MPGGDIGAPLATPRRTLRIRLATPSWILYDFSDTIFSFSILTFYFPLWVTEDAGGSDAMFTAMLSISSLLVALSAPMFGTISDRMGRRIPPLAVCIVVCVLSTALIGSFGGLSAGLMLFVLANFLYQTGLIFYNSLIINVSSETNRGIVSGIGVGAGYIGLIAAFLVMRPIIDRHGGEWAFILTASLYLLFALPMLLLVKEAGVSRRVSAALIEDSYTQLYRTFQRARRHANLFRFIFCRLAYMEAVNTVSSVYVLYLINVGDFTREQAQNMIFVTLFVATLASFTIGFLVSKTSPKRVLMVGLAGWIFVMLAASFANLLPITAEFSWILGWMPGGIAMFVDEIFVSGQWIFWMIALVMGLFWAAPQISDRVLLTRLAPEGQVGEFFGLFQVTGRLSSVVGPALWTLTLYLFQDFGSGRYRISLLMMSAFLIVGFVVMFWVRERREPPDMAESDEAAATT